MAASNTEPRRSNSSRRPSRLAFGSCNDQDRQNNMWPIIEARKPAAFVWGGDAIYADFVTPADYSTFPPTPPKRVCATPARVRKLYQRQLASPGYQSLLKTNMTIFGTIDDHDYGCDNADQTYPYKYETTNSFLDFVGEPSDSSVRRRAAEGRGVYSVKLFDFDRPKGMELVPEHEACLESDCIPMYSNKTVAVFVLDDPWLQGTRAYSTHDYRGDFLGEAQWKWFEQALRKSRAAVNVVVNGLQVNSNIFPNPNFAENWGSFPRAQQRLFDAVLGSTVQAPILISGDVHMGQMMRKDCRRSGSTAAQEQRSIFEMTTSGMTHSWGEMSTPPTNSEDDSTNQYRPGFEEYVETFVTSTTMQVMHALRPWTSLLVSSPEVSHDGGLEGAKQGLQYSLQRNFGELEFDWDDRTVTMRVMGESSAARGTPLLASKIKMDQLSGKQPLDTSFVTNHDFEAETALHYPTPYQGEWTCVSHRGHVSVLREMVGHITATVGILSAVGAPVLLPALCLLWLFRRSSNKKRTTLSQDKLLKSSPPAPGRQLSICSID